MNRISKYQPPSEKAYKKAIREALKAVQLELVETKGEWNKKRMAEIVKILRKDLRSPTAKFIVDFFDDLFSTIWRDTKQAESQLKGIINKPLFTLDKKTVEYVLSFKEVYFHRYNADGVSKYSLVSVDDLLKYTERNVVNKVKSIINTGAVTGVNPNEIVNQIGTLKGVSDAHLRTAVRTMFADAQNRIQMEHLKKNQDLYDEFEFVAKLDNRTSKICRETDDTIWQSFNDIPKSYYPPLHPNCRSIIVGNINL